MDIFIYIYARRGFLVQNVTLQVINILQHTATHSNTLQHTTTHCNTLQYTATHRNTLQHTATCCNLHMIKENPPYLRLLVPLTCQNTLQHTATHCNTLQHTATHCNTLQHTIIHCNPISPFFGATLPCPTIPFVPPPLLPPLPHTTHKFTSPHRAEEIGD